MWLNEIIQPPPSPEANRWIQVTRWQMAVCDGDACAAAILAYFFARHHGKLKHVAEGREDNQIATAHGLKARRGSESLWFRATDPQIEEAIFFYKRRKFPEALAKLEALGFVSILRKNPNPNFPSDNSRYFKLNPEAVQKRLRELYDYKGKKGELNPLESSPRKNADTPPRPRETAETIRKNADTPRKNAEHIKKGSKEGSIEGEESPSGDSSSGVASKDEATPAVVSREQKLQLKNILEGVAPLPEVEGVEPDEALLEWLPVALQCSRPAQAFFAFVFWKLHHRHPRAIFDNKRKRVAEDRLKAGYTLDRLILAVRGVKFSAHHMAMNPKTNPDNKIFDDFGLILRDSKQVETFEGLAIESDEDERRRSAEGALASNLPPVPESRFTDAELRDFAETVADMLGGGYEVAHLRVKFNVGRGMTVAEWTRILELAAQIKTARDSPSMNGNGREEVIRAGESEEWSAASEAAASAEGGVRAMPYAREEDFEK